MRYIFLILLFPMFIFAQTGILENLFTSGSDTVGNDNKQDTLQWRLITDKHTGPWNNVTSYIDTTEKQAENSLVFDLANESGWTWSGNIQLRILSNSDTITSRVIGIGQTSGAITVFITPDTSNSKTIYDGEIGGR